MTENCTSQGSIEDIHSLVEGFRANLRNLRDEHTPEAVIRQEYIDTFWKLLGWDVANDTHRSLAEKDVVIEAMVGTLEGEKIRSRRPDYIFRIDGFTRFVVEAKPPHIDIQTDKDAIFQAKTYAWSAQIPFAVLTNFEQFRLFDATIKPYYAEPDRGIVSDFDLRFEDYTTQWDILWKIFSRSGVAGGSLEQLLATIKRVRKGRRIRGIDRMLIDLRGSEPVDRVFLQHLEDFRLRFARALYNENSNNFPEANTHHGAARLTEATQRLIDRLVFIRVCEDRDITPYGELRDILNSCSKNRLDLYSELIKKFRRFDEEYNGYIFKPHFSEQLKVPPELLADFIRSIYMPEGAYRFEAIGDDLLGIIYERFLGSTITVKQNNVEAEPKPEVRHAGGVYYTPRFVVDTIIRRVVGPKIKDKKPYEVLNTKILDPACGSGSFLIATLQFLIDHCIQYISEHPNAAEMPASTRSRTKKITIAFKDNEGNWHLSPKFRSQLLSTCIYGIDIDAQAVEVTIMSLYLKLLEGRLPPHWQRDFLQSRLLPPLDNNICCGNSLLSQTDFDKYWDNKFGTLFGGDEDLKFRINAFDWNSQTRGFGRLLDEHKGFDCIIGNPPYIRVQELRKWEPEECEFYKKQYTSAAKGNYDIYVVFIERGLQLLAPDGLLGFICPHKFWQATYGKGIREIVTKGNHIVSIIDFKDQQVFRGVSTYTAIHVFSNNSYCETISYSCIEKLSDGESQCFSIDSDKSIRDVVSFKAVHPISSEAWVFRNKSCESWCIYVAKDNTPLSEVASEIFVGLQTSADDVFLFKKYDTGEKVIHVWSDVLQKKVQIESSLLKSVVRSGNINRYIAQPTALVLFPYKIDNNEAKIISQDSMEKKFPLAWHYLKQNEKFLRQRESNKFDHEEWYGLMRKNLEKWEGPKIMVPYMVTELNAFYDDVGNFFFVNVTTGGFGIHSNKIDSWLLTAYLSSSLLDTWFKTQAGKFHGGYFGANKQYIEDLPIKLPITKQESKLASEIISLSKSLHKLKKRIQITRLSDRERERHEREIEANELQVNELVCKLYGVDKIPE